MGISPILQDATLSVHLAQMLSMSAPAGGAAAGDADDAAPIHLGLLECEEERSKLQHKLIYDALCNLETADALAAFVTHCNTALVQSDDICKLLGIPFRCESNLHSFMCFLLYIHQRSVTDIMLNRFHLENHQHICQPTGFNKLWINPGLTTPISSFVLLLRISQPMQFL